MSFSIIQGGMGVGVSDWKLANAVSRRGHLGVVSGTGLAVVLARRLQLGDLGGHIRRAMEHFPIAGVAQRVLKEFFIPGNGKAPDKPFRHTRGPELHEARPATDLTVLANFVEVFLAKEGHAGKVGVNYLEKIQIPTLASFFGAMLAGVDFVLMGAGIPRFIPGALDALAQGRPVQLAVNVAGTLPGESYTTQFDPVAYCAGAPPSVRRPAFLAIISSATLAMTLARKANGRVDGFIVEGATAGGHNAPPRGPMQANARGEPIYGPRDIPDMQKIRELGLPFWMAGGYATPEKLAAAQAMGAAGIQVGTAFAFCAESAIDPAVKQRVLAQCLAGKSDVLTDANASPTGFPFKVLQLPGTASDVDVYQARRRICDMGYLREAYRRENGTVGYRCPSEPVEQYVLKGGAVADTVGRKCLCNALFANIGLAQVRNDGTVESCLLTAGDDVENIERFLPPGQTSYTADDVLNYLLQPPTPVPSQQALASTSTA